MDLAVAQRETPMAEAWHVMNAMHCHVIHEREARLVPSLPGSGRS